MVVALIALFTSLGGVSYGVATGSIDSREILNGTVRSWDVRNNDVRTRDVRNNDIRSWDIRNNEVRGRDIRNGTIGYADVGWNALTGEDISESTLQGVGSLKFSNIDYRSGASSNRTTILNVGGLRITSDCLGVPGLRAHSAVPDAKLRYFAVTGDSAAGKPATVESYQTEDLDPGDDFDLAQSGTEDIQAHVAYVRPDGGHVEVDLNYDGAGARCSIQGHAVAG